MCHATAFYDLIVYFSEKLFVYKHKNGEKLYRTTSNLFYSLRNEEQKQKKNGYRHISVAVAIHYVIKKL